LSPCRKRPLDVGYVRLSLLLGYFGRSFIHDDVLRVAGLLVGYIFASICVSVYAFLFYKMSSNVKASHILFVAVLACDAFFWAGVLVVELQMEVGDTYIITTKDKEHQLIQNARILRSSSAGFILLADKTIYFIPHSEITKIKSTAPLLRGASSSTQ
jgi:hypothetical protein